MREFLTAIFLLVGFFWRSLTKSTVDAIALAVGVIGGINFFQLAIIFFAAGKVIFYQFIAFELFVCIGATLFWIMAFAGYGIFFSALVLLVACLTSVAALSKGDFWIGSAALVASISLCVLFLHLQLAEVKLFFRLVKNKLAVKKEIIARWSAEKIEARVIVLTASAGSGHLVAARNIASALEKQSPAMKIQCVNIFDFLDPTQRMLQESVWEYLAVYAPAFYRPIHRFILWDTKRLIEKAARKTADALVNKAHMHPLVIIATHPMAVAVGSQLKKRWGSKLVVVPTDYYVHPHYTANNVDLYCLPDKECLFVGVDKDEVWKKAQATGIPIHNFDPMPKSVARRELAVSEDDDRVVIFVNFGGTGALRAKTLIELMSLVLFCEKPFHFLVPEKLCEILPENNGEIGKWRRTKSSWAAVRNPRLAMDACDVMIGKIGGLSIAEALSQGVPIGIWTHAGPEDFNAKFLRQTGKGVKVGGFLELLLDFPETKCWITDCAKKEVIPSMSADSAAAVAKNVTTLIGK